jgi:hypothetical protein
MILYRSTGIGLLLGMIGRLMAKAGKKPAFEGSLAA